MSYSEVIRWLAILAYVGGLVTLVTGPESLLKVLHGRVRIQMLALLAAAGAIGVLMIWVAVEVGW